MGRSLWEFRAYYAPRRYPTVQLTPLNRPDPRPHPHSAPVHEDVLDRSIFPPPGPNLQFFFSYGLTVSWGCSWARGRLGWMVVFPRGARAFNLLIVDFLPQSGRRVPYFILCSTPQVGELTQKMVPGGGVFRARGVVW